jgi:Bacterial PH domain
VSASNDQARAAVPVSVGRLLPDGRRMYRLVTPQVVWWTWVGLGALSIGDLIIQGHNYLSLKFALGLLTATGLVFACTLWPRVIADEDGITVQNPLRRFRIPWAAVRGIFLADSVEIQCARSAQKKDKTVYSWALSSARRGRAKARLHGWQWDHGRRSRPPSYGQLPDRAKELAKMTQTEIIAREMAKLSEEAKARRPQGRVSLNGTDAAVVSARGPGAQTRATAPAEVVTASWSWPALAAFLVPGIVFAIVMLAG